MTRHIVLFGLVGLAACARDTRMEEQRPTEQARVPANLQVDQDFIQKAASGGMFEVESARLAMSRQATGDTTELAQTLIRDHSQANDKLKQLAQEKAIEMPEQMLPEHEQQLEQLRAAEGEQFSPMFQQVQAQAHKETIALFERCAQYCQDMDIREYASNTLPTLREHMREVEQMDATALRPEERVQREMERQGEMERLGEPQETPQPE